MTYSIGKILPKTTASAIQKKKNKSKRVSFNDQPTICYTYGTNEYDRSCFAIDTSASSSASSNSSSSSLSSSARTYSAPSKSLSSFSSSSARAYYASVLSSALSFSSVARAYTASPVLLAPPAQSTSFFMHQMAYPHYGHHIGANVLQSFIYMNPPIVRSQQKKAKGRMLPPLLKVDTSINDGLGPLFLTGDSTHHYYNPFKKSVTNRYTSISSFFGNNSLDDEDDDDEDEDEGEDDGYDANANYGGQASAYTHM